MLSLETINDEIKQAMLAKNRVKLETLRSIKKEFLDAKTAKGAADTLSEETIIAILQKMVKQRKESATIYISQGRTDLAEVEVEQFNVIEEYLPEQLSPEELEKAVKKIIADVGATSMKEMGKVMGVASKELAGKAEGKLISEMVRGLLG